MARLRRDTTARLEFQQRHGSEMLGLLAAGTFDSEPAEGAISDQNLERSHVGGPSQDDAWSDKPDTRGRIAVRQPGALGEATRIYHGHAVHAVRSQAARRQTMPRTRRPAKGSESRWGIEPVLGLPTVGLLTGWQSRLRHSAGRPARRYQAIRAIGELMLERGTL